MPLESKFKTKLIKELEQRFPGCKVIHTDASECQGIPDLILLYKNRWAALEGKRSSNSHKQQNQEYYVNEMNKMSFAAFISPENKDEVLNDIQQSFES